MNIPKFLYKFLLLIETFQILSFCYNNSLIKTYDSQISILILKIFEFTQFKSLMVMKNELLNYILIITCLTIVFLNSIFLIILISKKKLIKLILTILKKGYYKTNKENKESTCMKYITNTSSIIFLLIKTCLSHLILQAFISSFFCSESSSYFSENCYTGFHLTIFILSGIGLIFILVFRFISTYFLLDFNYSSDLPFAGFPLNMNFLYYLPRTIIAIFSIIDQKVI